jgi:hypothetical protein
MSLYSGCVKKFFRSFFQKLNFFFVTLSSGMRQENNLGFSLHDMQNLVFSNYIDLVSCKTPVAMKYLKIIFSQEFKSQRFAFFARSLCWAIQ